MSVIEVDGSFATVGARTDIDGAVARVVVDTNRTFPDGEAVVIEMEPKVARALARKLHKWATLVDSVSR